MTDLIHRLPPIQGSYTANFPLADLTTIKVGGPAEIWTKFHDINDLCSYIKAVNGTPFTVIGEGSNMVIRDGGIAGVVTNLGAFMSDVTVEGDEVYAQAGATCGKVARAARQAALSGVEFYAGIPGGIGGALRMNAGCYGVETADRIISVDVMTNEGKIQTLKPEELNYSYRHSELPEGWLFLGARFKLVAGDKEKIRDAMRKINAERRDSQPLNMPSSGSWFKNVVQPDGTKLNAWKVVDAAGCRGWKVGGAQVSEKHCNFFVNTGGATAQDLLKLTEKVEAEILKTQGIKMVREVKFTGKD
ncbi:MAG: UDP-N-acetylmuramate dehydrogenase [Alphaproteobacteria bacterium]|nr:UDP-N-acetylmuramate dehydrogenase [Alphaproteobacteria bacterium]MDD9919642.1 UDP-N-acetylmuramate dehydrogenase [Alphaproteobacteria bacterium]